MIRPEQTAQCNDFCAFEYFQRRIGVRADDCTAVASSDESLHSSFHRTIGEAGTTMNRMSFCRSPRTTISTAFASPFLSSPPVPHRVTLTTAGTISAVFSASSSSTPASRRASEFRGWASHGRFDDIFRFDQGPAAAPKGQRAQDRKLFPARQAQSDRPG